MTTFKKIDWLRQLYHEGMKWKHSLAGQVKWSKLEVKDPNNGSKFTVADLEKYLPEILDNCLNDNKIPFEYLPEVKKCLAYIRNEEKFDCKAVSKLVQARKDTLCLFETLLSYSNLPEERKTDVIRKIDMDDLPRFYQAVQQLKMELQGAGSTGDEGTWTTEEKPKQFKLIDWLRHMYLMCQKWLNNRQGQLQWKVLDAKDPNNNKEGSRMKLGELKESLKVLAAKCLDLHLVSKPYLSELTEVQRVLNGSRVDFNKKVLEAEEGLRKIATKIVELVVHHDDMCNQLLSTIEPSKVKKMSEDVADLEEKLGKHFGQEVPEMVELETVEVLPLQVEEDLEQMIEEEHNICQEGDSIHEITQPGYSDEGPVNDGTDILLAIMEQASTSCDPEVPCSPSSGSEVLSEISSPPSPDRRSLDDHFSDDSGIFSPESNPLDIEDVEFEVDNDLMGLDFSDEEIEVDNDLMKLDFSDLPDVTPYLSQVKCQKRRLSGEDFDEPALKRARP